MVAIHVVCKLPMRNREVIINQLLHPIKQLNVDSNKFISYLAQNNQSGGSLPVSF